jgi:hypothetical protein
MKSEQWKTYRTRFLVKAKQLNSTLSFVDSLGRQHSGRKGDYLVESSDGVVSIAPRRIFEDIYVAMPLLGDPGTGNILIGESSIPESSIPDPTLAPNNFEPLHVEHVKLERVQLEEIKLEQVKRGKPPIGRQPARGLVPQPARDRRDSTPRLGLM